MLNLIIIYFNKSSKQKFYDITIYIIINFNNNRKKNVYLNY